MHKSWYHFGTTIFLCLSLWSQGFRVLGFFAFKPICIIGNLRGRRNERKKKMTKIYYIGGSPCAGKSTVAEILWKNRIPNDRYISITPTPEFQVFHFKKREFVPYILEGCSDKEKGFDNWMGRDILFAKEVQKQCQEEGYVSVINDGNLKIDKLVDIVSFHFGLGWWIWQKRKENMLFLIKC